MQASYSKFPKKKGVEFIYLGFIFYMKSLKIRGVWMLDPL